MTQIISSGDTSFLQSQWRGKPDRGVTGALLFVVSANGIRQTSLIGASEIVGFAQFTAIFPMGTRLDRDRPFMVERSACRPHEARRFSHKIVRNSLAAQVDCEPASRLRNTRDGAAVPVLTVKAQLCHILFLCDPRHTFNANKRSSSRALDHVYRPQDAQGETVMKIIVSALLALSVLAGIAAPASAYDPWKDDVGLRSPL